MTYRNKHLVIPLAGALVLGLAVSASAQSRTGQSNSADHSAAATGRANGVAASLKGESRSPNAVDTGKDAIARDRARRAAALANASAAPVALALADQVPPSSSPEPLTIALVGGALAGLYRMRRHLA